METWQRHHISAILPRLLNLTKFTTFMKTELLSHKLLNCDDIYALEAVKSHDEKNFELYQILMRKTGAFDKFSDILDGLGQTGAAKELRGKPVKIWYGITQPCSAFFGRKEELRKLHEFVVQKSSEHQLENVRCVVGMGGIGKTELCRQYFHVEISKINCMDAIWINGETDLSITASFIGLADILHIPTKESNGEQKATKKLVADIFHHLQDYSLIIVFDNVDTIETFLAGEYVSLSYKIMRSPPKFLITSRNCEWDQKLGVSRTFTLDNMVTSDAVDWILHGLSSIENSREEATQLVMLLDHYTLALKQAISYITAKNESRDYGVKEYIQNFNNTRDKLEIITSKHFINEFNTYKKTTFTTFFTSMGLLIQETNAAGLLALKFLFYCAYINPDDIAISMFITPKITETVAEQSLHLLIKYSLLRRNNKKNFTIHRILQEVLRFYLTIKKSEWPNDGSYQEVRGITNKVLSTEASLLSGILKQLNSKCLTETQHAANVWSVALHYHKLVKTYYKKSRYGSNLSTPLHIFAEEKDITSLKNLIAALKKLSARVCKRFFDRGDEFSRTAAFLAAAAGHSQHVEALFEAGADLAIPCSLCYVSFEKMKLFTYHSTNYTPMHVATYNEHTDTVRKIYNLDSELVKHKSTLVFDTPYSLAAKLGNFELLSAIPEHKIADKICAYVVSISKGILNIKGLQTFLDDQPELLEEKINENVGDAKKLMYYAIWSGASVDVLKLLVTNGYKFQIEDFCFHFNEAAMTNNVEAFKWLALENLKLVDKVNIHRDWTPLYEAAKYGALDVVKFIVSQSGINGIPGLDIGVDYTDGKGDTPLYQAAKNGKLDVVKYLISEGADVNKMNAWGSMPITAAALHAKFEVVNYLARLPQTVIEPAKIMQNRHNLLGMLNLTAIHAFVAYDLVEDTDALLELIKEKDDALFTKLMNGSKQTEKPIMISLLHVAVFFDSPKVLQNLLMKHGSHMRLNPKASLYHFLHAFMVSVEHKTFHIPRKLKIAAKIILKIMTWFPDNEFFFTPVDLSKAMHHTLCSEILKSEPQSYFGYTKRFLVSLIMPQLKTYQQSMKQYLSVHRGNKVVVGKSVTMLVNESFLGWDLTRNTHEVLGAECLRTLHE